MGDHDRQRYAMHLRKAAKEYVAFATLLDKVGRHIDNARYSISRASSFGSNADVDRLDGMLKKWFVRVDDLAGELADGDDPAGVLLDEATRAEKG